MTVRPDDTPTQSLRVWLHVEGAAIAVAAIVLYSQTDASWVFFALCFLLPDLSALGYLLGPRIGALCYNLAHSYVGPLLLAAAGVWASLPLALPLAAIWGAHIGLDRAIGYGLKYAGKGTRTHLQVV